ncbi:MAG: hypothetical protein WAT81_02390 [Candidatus Moraniibacteriota bacterium]
MKSKVIRTDPELWENCKQEVLQKLGKFSARAIQQAVVLYTSRGGGYVGEKSAANSLVRWDRDQSLGK